MTRSRFLLLGLSGFVALAIGGTLVGLGHLVLGSILVGMGAVAFGVGLGRYRSARTPLK